MLRFVWLLLGLCVGSSLLAACSGPTPFPPTCNLTYDCGPQQTCRAQDGLTYECVPAGAGMLGASCDPSLQAGAECGEGLVCLGLGDPPLGTCTGWCGPSRPCPSDQACVVLTTAFDVDVRVCSVSSSSSCAFNYDCAAGETCSTMDGFAFDCVPAGSLALGAACDAADAAVQCGEGLVCFGAESTAVGKCSAWCAVGGGCPSGQSCATLGTTHGITVHVCQ